MNYKQFNHNVEKRVKTLQQAVDEKIKLDEEFDPKDYTIDFFKDFPELRTKAKIFDEENYHHILTEPKYESENFRNDFRNELDF